MTVTELHAALNSLIAAGQGRYTVVLADGDGHAVLQPAGVVLDPELRAVVLDMTAGGED